MAELVGAGGGGDHGHRGNGDRPSVVVVQSSFGASTGDRAAAVRLVAGALALTADVTIVSLDNRSNPAARPPAVREDGIFPVYSVSAAPSRPRLVDVLRTALVYNAVGTSARSAMMPEIASRRLIAMDSEPSPEAVELIGKLSPQVVVLSGIETLWLAEALPLGPSRPRVVALPLLGDDERLESPGMTPLAEVADAVGAFSDVEAGRLGASIGARDPSIVRRIRLTFPVNRQAAQSGLAGMASFGRYVLVISGWPPDEPASGRSPAHDYLRAVAGDVSVAEVRHGRWTVSEWGRHHEFPWAPSRMNLWRLMAGAIATVDVRRQGPVGREAVESLSFGTPVVVPAGSVAAEHAASSNGGLWWGTPGEMVDQVRYFCEDGERRERCSASGRAWAEREHGDTERAVDEIRRLVFGEGG